MINDMGDPATCRENELLRLCARVAPAAAVQARMQELAQQPLDWPVVLNRSWWHRIRPLTFRHLESMPFTTMPDDVRTAFIAFVDELSQRGRRLATALRGVAQIFEEAQVRAVVFKGPTLAEDAYGDVTFRECGDLDLLIDQHEFHRIHSVLLEHGFRSYWDSPDNPHQVFACEFERADATLDVHWGLAPGWLNYRVDFESLWQAGEPLLKPGNCLRKLRPEDGVSVLAIHGTKHWWDRMRWIADVAELVNSGRLADWDRVEQTSAATHCRRSVSLGLYLAYDLLDAALPKDVARSLQQTSGVVRLGKQVGRWLEYAERSKAMRNVSERFRFRMGVCERKRDQLPQIIHYLFARPRSAAPAPHITGKAVGNIPNQ